ncbi:hypothetical protein DEO72_LG11g1818 [Vigna unguiculata]|uniref:Uncharacterized protein n=1 Tax=Vigna unguiculata TaxID=3917 RepID=A0A4D6NP75_VIGUN|nr:hypothetical protein DEO72_LG11g1818 [Vigna unguiculata]
MANSGSLVHGCLAVRAVSPGGTCNEKGFEALCTWRGTLNQTQSYSSINRLAGDTCCQALPAPRPPGGVAYRQAHSASKFTSPQIPPSGITLTAKRPRSSVPLLDSYCLELQTRPPGAAPPGILCFPLYRLAEPFLPARRYTRIA